MDKHDVQALKALKELLSEWGLEDNRAKNTALQCLFGFPPKQPVFPCPVSNPDVSPEAPS